jgi:acyl-CoA reductase-like NAD-dependent aldehyde dehydrogenase
MTVSVESVTGWRELFHRARTVAPEAFAEDRLLNFWGGRWRREGTPLPATSPVDGTEIIGPSVVDIATAATAVRAALNEHRTWCVAAHDDRAARIGRALDDLDGHRDLLAGLLHRESGPTWRSATAEVDRCLAGARDDLAGATEPGAREPLRGPITACADAVPVMELVRGLLAQTSAGNAVVVKAPVRGAVNCLTLVTALVARHGVPFTLIGGETTEVEPALTRVDVIGRVYQALESARV